MSLINFKNEVLVRVYLVTMFILMAAIAIFFKGIQLVFVEGAKWRQKSVEKFVSYRPMLGERGNIISSDGALLATSIPYFDVYWDSRGADSTEFIKNLDSLSYDLSVSLGTEYTAQAWHDYLFTNRFTYHTQYVPIVKGLTPYQLAQIKTFPIFKNRAADGGVIVVRDNKREHPFRMLALRTLGYVKEGVNPVGLEGRYNNVLSGDTAKVLMRKLSADTYIPVNDLTDIEPKHGIDIVTTIDANVQEIAQTALVRSLERYQGEHGCAIVMEVKTGKIKAITNIGRTEDKKNWTEDYNYAIGAAIEPGSTWKLASMLSLLEDDAVKLTDTVDIRDGSITYYDQELVDHERAAKRLITVREAFAESSNVGISQLVFRYYKDKPKAYIKHLKDFLLTIPTEIEVPGEATPYIKNPDDVNSQWSGITLPWMSIGYELQITPLQLLTFYNAVANDGEMMKPYLVTESQRYGETIQSYKPTVLKRRIATKNSIEQAKLLLESVVEFGTAKASRSKEYKFAGKTGTAQLNYSKEKNKNHTGGYQGSFVGYFPAENPMYSCLVMVSKPKSGYYGGIVAAPVFREIADKLMATNVALSEPLNNVGKPVLTASDLPRTGGLKSDILKTMQTMQLKHEILPATGTAWANIVPKNDTIFVNPRSVNTKKMVPSVVGLGLMDALFLLENRGLRVQFSGYGKVVSQSISPGIQILKPETILLKLE